jgi:hypothetical protein
MKVRRIDVAVCTFMVCLSCCLLVSNLSKVREPANRMTCTNNLKVIGLALHTYHDTHGRLPRATVPNSGLPSEDRLSWLAAVLPYMGQESLARKLDVKKAWRAEENRLAVRTRIKELSCPTDRDRLLLEKPHFTSYVGLAGTGADAADLPVDSDRAGFFGHERDLKWADLRKGTSYIAVTLETTRQNGPWAAGGPITVRGLDADEQPYLGADRQFAGIHYQERMGFFRYPSHTPMLMADGWVRLVKPTLSPQVFEQLVTLRGTRPPEDWE